MINCSMITLHLMWNLYRKLWGDSMEKSRKIFLEDLEEKDSFNDDELKSLYENIADGLNKHDYYNDKELLFKVKDIFIEHKMMFETAHITKEIGISYYKEGNMPKTIRYIENAAYILQNISDNSDMRIKESLVNYLISIGVAYFEILSYQSSINTFKKCSKLIDDKLSDNVLYRYYHEYAIASIYAKDYDYAKKLLDKSLEYAHNNVRKGFIYNDLGRYYWKINRPLDSRRTYDKALEVFKAENHNNGLAMIYNNLAMLYYTTKKIEQASEWIEKCFEIFDRSNPKKCVIYFDTYIRIILRKHDFGKALDKLLEFIKISDNYLFDKRYILDALDLVVDRISKFKNEKYGTKLKNILIHLIKQNDDDDIEDNYYSEKLYSYLGRLMYLFYKKRKRRD